ncbi:response regulator, partial [bacterium]|nr:response regulator [bacterium]
MNTIIRILILEDVPEDAELLERILRKEKLQFTARTADNKEDFLKELKDFSPDLILSDYSMPRFTGLEALKIVKEIAPSIPLIIITGSINEETAVECMKAGAVDYVLKDRLTRIVPAVQAALENKHIRDEKARIEKALTASAREWESTFDAINDAVCLLDMNGNVLRCNNAMKSLVGKPFDAIIGKGCSVLFRNAVSSDKLCLFARMHESLHRETTRVELNGRWLDILLDPILDETGSLIGGVQIVSDITESMRAEEELRESEER